MSCRKEYDITTKCNELMIIQALTRSYQYHIILKHTSIATAATITCIIGCQLLRVYWPWLN